MAGKKTLNMAAKLNLNLDNSSVTLNSERVLKTKPVTIYHSIHYRGSRFRISSGQAVEPKHWDKQKDKQEVRRTRVNYNVYNSLLRKQQNDIERIIMNLEMTGKAVTKENIVIQLPWTNSIEVKEFKPLSLFSKFIEQHKSERAERTIPR